MEFLLMPILIFVGAIFFRLDRLEKKHDEMIRKMEVLREIAERSHT